MKTVCHCFGHTEKDIETQIQATGTSTIPNEIAEKCRLGLGRCSEMNPSGKCCLGDVRRVVKLLSAR